MDKKVDVTGKYEQELLDIKNVLNQLDQGRVYEISNIKTDGYLSTNIKELKKMLAELIYKIEHDADSKIEKLQEVFDKKDFK